MQHFNGKTNKLSPDILITPFPKERHSPPHLLATWRSGWQPSSQVLGRSRSSEVPQPCPTGAPRHEPWHHGLFLPFPTPTRGLCPPTPSPRSTSRPPHGSPCSRDASPCAVNGDQRCRDPGLREPPAPGRFCLARRFQPGCPPWAGMSLAVSPLPPLVTTQSDVTSRVKPSTEPRMAAASPRHRALCGQRCLGPALG